MLIPAKGLLSTIGPPHSSRAAPVGYAKARRRSTHPSRRVREAARADSAPMANTYSNMCFTDRMAVATWPAECRLRHPWRPLVGDHQQHGGVADVWLIGARKRAPARQVLLGQVAPDGCGDIRAGRHVLEVQPDSFRGAELLGVERVHVRACSPAGAPRPTYTAPADTRPWNRSPWTRTRFGVTGRPPGPLLHPRRQR
jgi:hypothetical protein